MILTIVLVVIGVLVAIGLLIAAASVHVLREYERGVVFRLGRLSQLKGPGVIFLVPFINRFVRVSLRTVTLQVPPQEVITRDNVPARVTAVTYFRVVDPNKSIVEIQDVLAATSQIAQTTLRSVLGKADLDTLLSEREQLNSSLQQIIDDQTEPWGIKVTTVEIKDVEIPEQMQRSIARQAEAERERRAKIIDAEGEFQAAARLLEAANQISQNPVTPSCVTYKHCARSVATRTRQSCSRSHSTCSADCRANPTERTAAPLQCQRSRASWSQQQQRMDP